MHLLQARAFVCTHVLMRAQLASTCAGQVLSHQSVHCTHMRLARTLTSCADCAGLRGRPVLEGVNGAQTESMSRKQTWWHLCIRMSAKQALTVEMHSKSKQARPPTWGPLRSLCELY